MTALSGGHLATDFAGGALPALLPFLVDRFDLNYAMAALAILASAASSSLIQPLFGLWSDRRGAIWLLPTGVAVAGIGIALAAAAPSYWLVLLFVLVSGLGVAAFHPEGSKFAAYASGNRRASGMSYFSVGGNLGYALGPIVTTPLVRRVRAHAAGCCWRFRAWPSRRCCSASMPFLSGFVPESGRAGGGLGRARPARRARAPARRDRLPQRRLVRADHVRAAVGGLDRELGRARQPPALADAARRRRSGRSSPGRSRTASGGGRS